MAYEYGSTDLGIKNPFHIEGGIHATRGIILSLISVWGIFNVKGLVERGLHLEGWLLMGVSLLVLVHGLTVSSSGLIQVMRFFVGRGVPTSLAKNKAKSELHTDEPNVVYTDQDLEHMLQGRKNITISEPEGWFARFIHSIFPNLLFLPYAYRNIAQQLSQALTQSIFGLICFAFAWFSGVSGLVTLINETAVLEWMAIGLAIYFVIVWAMCSTPLSRDLQAEPSALSVRTITVCVAVSILMPVVLLCLDQYIWTLPDVAFPTARYLGIILILSCFTSLFGFVLLAQRGRLVNPRTEVAEMRDNWQESIHPQEIFINFENIVMANRRFKEVPNRVYRDYDAELQEEGSNDKGQFSGETIQETQPVNFPLQLSGLFIQARLLITIVGHFALFWAPASLFFNMYDFSNLLRAGSSQAFWGLMPEALGTLCFAAILWVFGSILVKVAHAFWAEMCFESLIVFFQCQGTYTESRLSTGTGIYDSLRSENVLVRSSMTPWLLVSRFVTSSFTESGSDNLEHPRHILEMHDADAELEKITQEVRGFLDNRETIASIRNMKDLHSTANIQQVNSAARVANAAHERENEANSHGQDIDHDRAIEYTGTPHKVTSHPYIEPIDENGEQNSES